MRNSWLRGELCVMWWPRWSKKKTKERGCGKGMRDERADDAPEAKQGYKELLKGRGRMEKDYIRFGK